MSSADLPHVYDMICQLAAHHGDAPTLTPETLARDTGGRSSWVTIIVAEHEGALIGYAALCPRITLQYAARGLDIHHLFVVQAHRGKGIGRVLTEAALAEARARACQYVTVGTHPDNIEAQEIYRQLGFETLDPPGPRFRISLEEPA